MALSRKCIAHDPLVCRSWSWHVGHLLYWVHTTSGTTAKMQHFPFVFSNAPVVLLQQNNWSWAQLGFSVATVHIMLCLKIFQISDTNATQRTTVLNITHPLIWCECSLIYSSYSQPVRCHVPVCLKEMTHDYTVHNISSPRGSNKYLWILID